MQKYVSYTLTSFSYYVTFHVEHYFSIYLKKHI